MTSGPRVAFFADSFHEVNGVALTSRQFDAFARRRQLPFLSAHAGPEATVSTEGSVTTVEFKRSAASFPIERDMSFDMLFARYKTWAADIVRAFKPDLIHITGPSDVGMMGAYLAYHIGVPLVASWHTNLHEFGARRLDKILWFLSQDLRDPIAALTERGIMASCAHFYKLAKVLLAPNQELVDLLRQHTGKPCFLMQRGADTHLFHPGKRTRQDDGFVLGFVGRVTPEKNVRLLASIEQSLLAAGMTNFRFLIVGDGSEREWLTANMKHAEFPGVLRGEALAEAYANMDLFVFPSHTDTFGNVVIEAFASGVPVVTTSSGGPKFLVRPGATGYVAAQDSDFAGHIVELIKDRELHGRMRSNARDYALSLSWDGVFEKVYETYQHALVVEPLFRAAS